jgi:DNA-binding NarL/FixJ family response regulator
VLGRRPETDEHRSQLDGVEPAAPPTTPHRTVRVLVVDPQPLVAECVRVALETEAGIKVVDVATTGRDAHALAELHEPDVVVLAEGLPDAGVAAVATKIVGSARGVAVVMVTDCPSPRMAMTALDAGCSGYVAKSSCVRTLVDAVGRVAEGQTVIESEVLTQVIRSRSQHAGERADLTPRQREILKLLARGRTNAEIGAALFISQATVRNHVHHILQKLDAHSRLEAVSIAVREGLVDYA